MFGFGFGELVVIVLVALVVMGPKDLPKMLRKVGRMAGKLRRMAADLRAQSGIDEALRTEGLADDIAEIRKLARGELDAVRREATVDLGMAAAVTAGSNAPPTEPDPYTTFSSDEPVQIVREREYPREGADSYGSLPDDAIVYAEGLAKSALARDALYLLGDASLPLPPEPPDDVSPAESAPGDAVPAAPPR